MGTSSGVLTAAARPRVHGEYRLGGMTAEPDLGHKVTRVCATALPGRCAGQEGWISDLADELVGAAG